MPIICGIMEAPKAGPCAGTNRERKGGIVMFRKILPLLLTALMLFSLLPAVAEEVPGL